MKEYVYVDSDLATSYFAQINQGMISKFLSNETSSDTGTNNGGAEKTGEGSGGIGIVSGKYTSKEVDTFSQAFMKSSSETVENVMHDFLIDMLIDMSTPETKTYHEGDFVLIKDTFNIYDFKALKYSISANMFKTIASFDKDTTDLANEIKKLKKKSNKTKYELLHIKQLESTFKENNDFSDIEIFEKAINIFETLFPNTILIKIGNTFSLCDKDKFRLSSPSMMPTAFSNRSLTVFATVISKTKEENRVLPTLPEEMLSKGSSIIPELLLSSLDIKKDGDYNLRPIAIYFE